MNVEEFLHPAQPASAIAALYHERPLEFQGQEVRYSEPGFMLWLDKTLAKHS